jgi:ribonuclease inhibitor
MGQVFYLDLKGISSKDELHALVRKELPLPDYYGDNLDALYDILTEQGEGWNIIFYNCSRRQERDDEEITGDIKKYLQKLEKMTAKAVKECDNLQVRFFP